MPNPVYSRADGVMETQVGDDLVALDVQSGDAFAMNPVAATIWRSLAEPKSFEKLRDELLGQYDVPVEQCTRELQDLLDELDDKGLIQRSG